jgi:NAD+ synthase
MKRRVFPAELMIEPEPTAALLQNFIAQEARRTGFQKVVVGLSGGVDSAVVAALCARALGAKNVHAFLLPGKTSSKDSHRDAIAVAKQLGLKTQTIDLGPMAEVYFRSQKPDQLRKGNVMARLRMIALFDMAKKLKALVAGTSNKTETFFGYTTWFGDSASSFQPIGDLYKSQVWQLAEWLKLPESVIAKAPTADLWPGQTDEKEMGIRYIDADRVLYALLDRGVRPSELAHEGFDKKLAEKVVRLIRSTQFKRQMPPVAKLSTRTVGTDFLLSRDFDPESGL